MGPEGGLGAADDILVEDVDYSYPNGTKALAGLNLRVRRGTVHGVVGPSGCGKSTLLHLLSGLSEPSHGSIVMPRPAGRDEDRLTMVFQKDTLLPWNTVAKNVGVYFTFHKEDKKKVRDTVQWLLELAGLSEVDQAYPYQLSGGMRRRVAFLSAVAPEPSVLLLDEPFSALDEPTRIAIHQDVHRIIRRLGMTVVLVTHDLAEALSLCDDVSILTKGPGRLAVTHHVPFGNDREMLELRQEPAFLRLYGQLWADLSDQITGGRRE